MDVADVEQSLPDHAVAGVALGPSIAGDQQAPHELTGQALPGGAHSGGWGGDLDGSSGGSALPGGQEAEHAVPSHDDVDTPVNQHPPGDDSEQPQHAPSEQRPPDGAHAAEAGGSGGGSSAPPGGQEAEHAVPTHDGADAQVDQHPPSDGGNSGGTPPETSGMPTHEVSNEHSPAKSTAMQNPDDSRQAPPYDVDHADTRSVLPLKGPLAPADAHTMGEVASGLLRGLEDSMTPLGVGGTLPTPLDDSKAFQAARGFSQLVVGVVEFHMAVDGEVAGTLLDATGVGAVAGVAINVGAFALGAEGIGNAVAGVANLGHAMADGPQQPSTPGDDRGDGALGNQPAERAGPSAQAPPTDAQQTPVDRMPQTEAPPNEGFEHADRMPETEAIPDEGFEHIDRMPETGGAPEPGSEHGSRLGPELEAPDAAEPSRIDHGSLDEFNRPTGVDCILKQSELHPDSKGPNPDPAAGIERGIGYDVSHLLAREFGGLRSPENLTAASQNSNRILGEPGTRVPSMREVEIGVGKALLEGQTVHYRVTPIYDGNAPYPSAFHMQASGSGPDGIHVDTVVRNWTHHAD